MDRLISRVRTRKTKTRQKQAGRAAAGGGSLAGGPLVGLLFGLLLWAVSMLLLEWEGVVGGRSDPTFLLRVAGHGAFLLAGLLATAVFLGVVKPAVLEDNRQILLMALCSILALAPAKALSYVFLSTGLMPPETVQFLLPYALAPLLATILVDASVGIAVGVWTCLVMALMVGGSLPAFIAGLTVTVVAARTAGRVRKRARVVRAGVIVGVVEMVCVFGLTAYNWQTVDMLTVLNQAGGCLVSGFFAALLVLLILPVLETAFGITTDITLLELSDLGHPLLQRLAIEAPGTYHHSLVVANLAQAAADEIGANGLLTRVGAYFHDVGKLTKPDFFAENIQYRSNPHDTLPPSMSTLVITSHVKEGLSLAVLHKLPEVIRKAVREHHGTGVLSFFHHKAVEQLREEPDTRTATGNGQGGVDDADFRYPGPRPATKETAILCLADAAEAASRSATKTTPGHLKDLVQDIVNSRLVDGQLDLSGLTLNELDAVKRSFVFTLTSMLHGRVPYPKNEDRDKQQARPATEHARAEKPDPKPDGKGGAPGTGRQVGGGVPRTRR